MLEKLLDEAWRLSRDNFGWNVWFYAPSFAPYHHGRFAKARPLFPTISITGEACALRCDHCGGRLLKGMIPAPTPEKLLEVCRKLHESGAAGCLISGGCLPDGSVPLDRFVDAIAQIKRETNLTVLVHTGLIGWELAKKLAEAGVDSALIDIIGAEETIRSVYHLDVPVDRYAEALEALKKVGIPTIPHVIVGLHYGRLLGEEQALKMVSRHEPSALVIIALIPIPKTRMEGVKPPSPESIAEIIAKARLIMPEVPIALGCMRPKGKHRIKTDKLALKAGVNAIAYPTKEAIEKAEELNLKINYSPLCCSQIHIDAYKA